MNFYIFVIYDLSKKNRLATPDYNEWKRVTKDSDKR